MPTSRATAMILITVSMSAVIIAAVSGSLARQYYLERSEMRLNPVNRDHFSDDNRALGLAAGSRIVFFGDSRIEGWNPRPPIPESELIWRGIGGETTAQMLYRFNDDALALDAGSIVIQAGINDIVLGSALGRGAQASATAVANLSKMTTMATSEGRHVVLMTVIRPAQPSLLRLPVWGNDIYDLVDQMNDQIRALARRDVTVLDADQLLAPNARTLPSAMSSDTLHLTALAYSKINTLLVATVNASTHAVQ